MLVGSQPVGGPVGWPRCCDLCGGEVLDRRAWVGSPAETCHIAPHMSCPITHAMSPASCAVLTIVLARLYLMHNRQHAESALAFSRKPNEKRNATHVKLKLTFESGEDRIADRTALNGKSRARGQYRQNWADAAPLVK